MISLNTFIIFYFQTTFDAFTKSPFFGIVLKLLVLDAAKHVESADVAQLVEHLLPKQKVASSRLVVR